VLLQANTLKQALRPYCLGGPFGRLLDAEAERLGEADVQAFETEGLIGTGAAPDVLAYLFHRIEGRLDGRPTLLIIDEGWLALDDPGFASQLREWLKTLRKKNASVVFATQSLADIETSAIAPAIVESCPTRIFLPNECAVEPQITAIYRRFGLNDRQIEILARAAPKRDYSRLLLPKPQRKPPVRAGPRRRRARFHRRVLQIRPERHRRADDRARAGRLRRGLAAPQGRRLGGRSPRRHGDHTMIRLRHIALAGAIALAIVAPARAQWIVYDPTNFSQNVLTAARELQQVNNEIQSLENQATMLINQAKNLASLPYSSVAQLETAITRTEQLLV
jgi:hypothetical protein